MAGFVKEVIPRHQAIDHVALELAFPWDIPCVDIPLEAASLRRIAVPMVSGTPYPPYTRSLRDGYAVYSPDVVAATSGTPTFLRKTSEVRMGVIEGGMVSAGEAAAIPTGGVLPFGADAVVMLEDTSVTGGWIEVRRGVQSGENIISEGEEIKAGARISSGGQLVDFRSAGILATLGINNVPVFDLRIKILSTGDEIVPVETDPLPPGCIRDVNGWSVRSVLERLGFPSDYRGIVSDDAEQFEKKVKEELSGCDVLILSGGSSVGTRDNCSRLLESMPSPGLLVRGINIVPGKPTLIAGCLDDRKLIVSLPGHPLSCLTVAYVVLVPLLLKLIGAENENYGHKIFLELERDLTARTGPEEFIPCFVSKEGRAVPLLAKSGYISSLASADGLIRLPEDRETVRSGETVEVWIW